MSNLISFSFDDGWEENSVWHISHKPNLHKVGIKRGQKTLNNYYSNKSNAVFVGSMAYCLTEYPKYTRNGIYYLYKIDSWHLYNKKGEWVGQPNHNNTKKPTSLSVTMTFLRLQERKWNEVVIEALNIMANTK